MTSKEKEIVLGYYLLSIVKIKREGENEREIERENKREAEGERER